MRGTRPPSTTSRRRSRSAAWDWPGRGPLHAQEATAGPGAELELGFLAKDIYLVLGGHGTVDVSVNGRHLATVRVGDGAEALHAVPGGATHSGTLHLQVSPGVQAYDFTFG